MKFTNYISTVKEMAKNFEATDMEQQYTEGEKSCEATAFSSPLHRSLQELQDAKEKSLPQKPEYQQVLLKNLFITFAT